MPGRGHGSWTTDFLAGTQSPESQIALGGSPAAPALQSLSLPYDSGRIPFQKSCEGACLIGWAAGGHDHGGWATRVKLGLKLTSGWDVFRKENISWWFELLVCPGS